MSQILTKQPYSCKTTITTRGAGNKSSVLMRSNHNQPILQLTSPTNSVVAVLSKPDLSYKQDFKPRPINHYRKRLIPNEGSGSLKTVGMPMDIPGGSHHLGTTTCPDNKVFVIKERIITDTQCKRTGDANKARQRVRGSAPRPCGSNTNKKYYNDSRSYLKARCRTHAQNLSLGKQNDDDDTFTSTSCTDTECDKRVIYKPSNEKFHTQGAVSSSNRLLRLKVDSVCCRNGV